MTDPSSLWVDGAAVPAPGLSLLALQGGGHYTTMQGRERRVRGLTAHLERLDRAHRELHGHGIDTGDVRAAWARATAEVPDCSLRSLLYDTPDGRTHVVVELLAPTTPPAAPLRLRSVRYERPLAHLKHVGTFAQVRHREAARRDGEDDALLVTPDGEVAETTIADIGFLRDGAITWPTAAALHGTGRALLRNAWVRGGGTERDAVVRPSDVPGFDAAFVVSSTGVVPVARIDDHGFRDAVGTVAPVVVAYGAVPWDPIEG